MYFSYRAQQSTAASTNTGEHTQDIIHCTCESSVDSVVILMTMSTIV